MRQWLVISLLLLWATCASAQNVQFTASVSHKSVAVGDRFKLTFTLNASGSRFTAPDLSAFSIYSGPNQSNNMSWINGQMSSSITYSYLLAAPKTGTYQINPAKVKVGNKIYQTNSIQLKVVKAAHNQQQQQQHYGYHKQKYHHQQVQPKTSTSNVSSDVFIKLITDRTKAYKRQQIIATYKLYFRVNIIDLDVNRLPSPTGFWSREVEVLGCTC